MDNDYNPKITALFVDDSAKKTIIGLLNKYQESLDEEYYSAEEIKRFLYQTKVKEEDLLNAMSHDMDFHSIARYLKDVLPCCIDMEDCIDAYEYDFEYE